MKTTAAAVVLLSLLSLTACAGSDDQVATDPAGSSRATPAMPTSAPAAPGPVSTQGLVTVVDTGDGPQVCLGPTTKIYPPQCTGPALAGWTWDDTTQREGGTRFGSWALTGSWDGSTLSVTTAIPAALYDAAAPLEPSPPPAGTGSADPGELAEIARTLGARLPGASGAVADGQGHVVVDVTYDDGSLQAWADRAYGPGVVVVQGQLVDAG